MAVGRAAESVAWSTNRGNQPGRAVYRVKLEGGSRGARRPGLGRPGISGVGLRSLE